MSTNRNGSRPCLVFLFKAYYAFGGAVVKRPVLSIRSDFWTLRDRYTVIDDEAFDDAIDKMNAYQKRQGMISELKELAARVESLSDAEFQRFVTLRQKVAQGSALSHALTPV